MEKPAHLVTVGHGTLEEQQFGSLVEDAGVGFVVDVRRAPGSRRHPAFGRVELERWLPQRGVQYRWEPRLGGFRRPRPDSRNVALRNDAFRGYADYMTTADFAAALGKVLAEATGRDLDAGVVSVMCAESVWWRCHRRLLADAAMLRGGAEVVHLMHDGRMTAHRLTDGVRLGDDGVLVYDGGDGALPGMGRE